MDEALSMANSSKTPRSRKPVDRYYDCFYNSTHINEPDEGSPGALVEAEISGANGSVSSANAK